MEEVLVVLLANAVVRDHTVVVHVVDAALTPTTVVDAVVRANALAFSTGSDNLAVLRDGLLARNEVTWIGALCLP